MVGRSIWHGWIAVAFTPLLLFPGIGLAAEAGSKTDAARPSSPVVLGFERFHGQRQDLALDGGRLLLGELNCLSCHEAPRAVSKFVETKKAPILDDVGARVRVQYLRKFLKDPHATKSGTTMPHLLASLPEEERTRTAEALVHFLAMTGSVSEGPAEREKIGKGERLFHETGCTACHAPINGPPLSEASIPLGQLSEKYTVPSLTRFLLDPLKVRPSARMPKPHLTKNETEELVSYLLKDLARILPPEIAKLPKIPYRYYEGSWSNLPDFDSLKPKAADLGPAFSPRIAERRDNFALEFEAWFLVPTTGQYTFELSSDDGSDLWVDGQRVIDNDGVHATETRPGRVELAQGPHQVKVRYFQAGGEISLDVKIGGPGLPMQPLGPLTRAAREDLAKEPEQENAGKTAKPQFVIQPELVKQGRELFASLGCASCHQLNEQNQPLETTIATRRRAKPLNELQLASGCLADSPQPGAPFVGLNETQRHAIARTLEQLKQSLPQEERPESQIAQAMLRLNCYACHDRGKIGGVSEARNALFQTTQQEMGDEGRLPPSLNGVGAKLTTEWLKKIFAEGANDRPYMLTRMPKFGEENIGHLQALFESLDTIEPVAVPEIALPARRVKSLGRMMCGDEIFGCIKCHTFDGERALGIQSIDMAIMTKRLKRDWFQRYLVDPAAFRPGTRMPSAWPRGKSTLQDVLDGSTEQQIEAIWQYLSDGNSARAPQGLGREAIVLAPSKEAVIYRNFIEGVGTRAIGVAYPENVNLAFDANEMRLALLWRNRFIDASMHWTGRGSGFQVPLGDEVLTLEDGPAFARLGFPEQEWPKESAKERGFQFRGYRLSPDNRPTFLYEFDGVRIEETPTAQSASSAWTLKRTMKLQKESGAKAPVYFRAAEGSKIEGIAKDTYRIDDDYLIRVESESAPVLMRQKDQWELRIPIKWHEDKATIVQEINW